MFCLDAIVLTIKVCHWLEVILEGWLTLSVNVWLDIHGGALL